MEIIWIILTTITVLALGFILGKYLKKQGLINENVVDYTNQLFLLVKIITMKTIKDEKEKVRVESIFDAIQDVFKYIYIMTLNKGIEDRKDIAKQQIMQRLHDFRVKLEPEDEVIIDIIIENFVALISQKTK